MQKVRMSNGKSEVIYVEMLFRHYKRFESSNKLTWNYKHFKKQVEEKVISQPWSSVGEEEASQELELSDLVCV